MTHNGNPNSHNEFSPSENGPAAVGIRIVALFHDSARTMISGCILLRETIWQYRGQQSAIDEVIAHLVSGKVLSRAKGRLGRASPKLSKFCRIGEKASLLLHPSILSRLPATAYTIAYQMILLHDALQGDDNARAAKLIQIIEKVDGELSRKFLEEETAIAGSTLDEDDHAQAPNSSPESNPTHLNQGAEDLFRACELILIEPSATDLRVLGEDYPELGTPARSLTLFEYVADDATAIAIVPVLGLSVVAIKLLPFCGFKQISHALLLRQPLKPDVLGETMVLIAHRGKGHAVQIPTDFWSAQEGAMTSTLLADLLIPGAANKLHAFAKARVSGWLSLIGDENWVERPSLR